MRYVLLIILLIHLSFACGCAVVSEDWHDVNLRAPPWIAPGRRIVWQERISIYPLMVVPPTFEYRMLDEARKPIREEWLPKIGAALRATPMWDQWPKSPANDFHPEWRVPPLQFALVSLRPTVVLAWYSGNVNVWDQKWLIDPHDRSYDFFNRDPLIPGLGTQIVRIAAIPPVEHVYWFLPELGHMDDGFQEATRVDATHMRIVLPKDELLLELTPYAWTVTRKANETGN